MLAAPISSWLRLSILFQKLHCHAAACQNAYPRPATNQPFAGVIFSVSYCAFKVLYYYSISPSYLFSCCSWQFDRFQECWCFSQRVLEAVAADASDNYPQPKATAVPWIPLWVISRHAHAIPHIRPPRASPQKGHISQPSPQMFLHFC